MAIIHAVMPEMRELALRVFFNAGLLPLYDADCTENGNIEFDPITSLTGNIIIT